MLPSIILVMGAEVVVAVAVVVVVVVCMGAVVMSAAQRGIAITIRAAIFTIDFMTWSLALSAFYGVKQINCLDG
jgi:hypothetical protein